MGAESGNAGAQRRLGWAYMNGEIGVAANNETAFMWLHMVADCGDGLHDGLTQWSLGVAHENSDLGLVIDKVKALKWYRIAAESGNCLVQLVLTEAYGGRRLGPGD